jgi:phosphotransacetylase
MTADECRAALLKSNYFGTMLVKMGCADALLGGATYSTADTVRPALQLVRTKPGNKIRLLLLYHGARRRTAGDGRLRHQSGPDGG